MKKRFLAILAMVPLMAISCGSSHGGESSEFLSNSTSSSSEQQSSTSVSSSEQSQSSHEASSSEQQSSSQEASNSEQSSSSTQEEKVLESITLDTTNVQTTFFVNEVFNYQGLEVFANYVGGESKRVYDFVVSTPDMSAIGKQNIIVSYTENAIKKTSSYEILIRDTGALTPITDEDIASLQAEVRRVYNSLDSEDYSKNGWKRIVNYFTNGISAIANSVYLEDAIAFKEEAINNMLSVIKQADVTKGTLFDYVSANSNYEFDRDEDNNITISYDGYPGHWVHTGTSTNFAGPATGNNIFKLTFRNDVAQEMEVCAQITDGGDYKVDSQIVKVAANETKTIQLDYDEPCSKFYFFVDSCSEHNRKGQITILGTEFSYEQREQQTKLYEPKDVIINKDTSKAEDGTATTYTLVENDHPRLIERVSAVVEVRFNGNDDGHKYFGFVLHVGSQKSSQMKESEAHAQDIKEDGVVVGSRYIFNYALSGKVSAGSAIYGQIAYGADGLTFKVISYRLHYCINAQTVSETIQVNTPIYQNGSGYIDGNKDNGYLTMSVPFSSFANRGRVVKMDVAFTSTNNESWGKSQIYFTGFHFTYFESGNNNVLNIGPIMDTAKTGSPKSGVMTIYPTENLTLKGDEVMTAVCWWASASSITVDSITMYTDVAFAPQAVTELEAHPVDSGVVLTWTSSEFATEYDVYVNGELHSTVSTSYATINGLTNGTTYTFGVVAKNTSGSSEMATTQAAPQEGATYDTFIEGLNTDLEEMIGANGIADMFNAGNEFVSTSNNERLKSVITKMQNGEETTIAYMGGSITVGENATLKDENKHQKGYAYYSYQWLKRTYDVQNKSNFINASISGTGSEIGIVRAEEDVLSHKPDLIFIEFAANNGSTDFYKQTYESLIRKCLSLDNDPAIILLFSCTSYTLNGAKKYMAEIGNHYSLPMYTFDNALRAVCTPYNNKYDKTGDPIWNAFSNDGTHPNDEGHQLYAKCLCYFLRTIISRSTDPVATRPSSPTAPGMDKYDNLHFQNNKNSNALITSLGSFVATNTATTSTSKQSDVTAFQNGWKKTDTTVNEAMVIDVHAKNFILVYEAGNKSVAGDPTGNVVVTFVNKADASDTGTLTWDVSKTCKQTTSGSTEITDQSGSGWENPVAILIFDKTLVGDYTVTISMETVEGICTIMAFGYTD